MNQTCTLTRFGRPSAAKVVSGRWRAVICLLLMFALPNAAMAGFAMASCQHASHPARAAVHPDGARVDHVHHHQNDHGPNTPHGPCSALCALACALVYALPLEAHTLQHLTRSDHPVSATQREWSDAPSGQPFRPPIFLSA